MVLLHGVLDVIIEEVDNLPASFKAQVGGVLKSCLCMCGGGPELMGERLRCSSGALLSTDRLLAPLHGGAHESSLLCTCHVSPSVCFGSLASHQSLMCAVLPEAATACRYLNQPSGSRPHATCVLSSVACASLLAADRRRPYQ